MIAFGFDFDHTLGTDHGLERKALYAYAQELGHPLDPDDATWHARLETLLAEFREGALTADEMVRRFGDVLKVPGADVERWRAHCYALVDELVVPLDGAPELLASLSARGVPTAILTNGWSPLQQKKIARALGEDGRTLPILVSDEIRAVKPAKAAFDALVDALGVPRADVWYVGDNARGDAGGALAAGLRAMWV
ncbi:MAG: HAD family hydrolase, partial [Candidatus Eremiobacteraeota bacterium]|nr:HAD family hydrolase [Candidatus Eremiobacteraeota bacterium]